LISRIQRRLGVVGLSALVRIATFPVTALATFVSTSLIIGYAGASAYAAIMIVITLSQMVPYADLGIGAGVINTVSTSEDGDAIRIQAIASAMRILLLSMCVLAGLGVLGAFAFSWSDVLSLGGAGLRQMDPITGLVIVLFAMTIPLGMGQRILLALLMNPLAIAISAVLPILSLLGTLLIVGCDLPAELLVFPPVIAGFLAGFLALCVAFKRVGFHWPAILRRRQFRLSGLLTQGLWYLAISVVSAFAFQWGRVVVGTRGSLSEVATYSIAMQFYAPLWSFFIAAGTSLWPVFARQRARGASYATLLTRMITYFLVASVTSLIGLVSVGPWLASVLSHGLVETSPFLFVACGAMIVVQSVQLVLGVSLTSLRDLRFQALWGIPMAISVLVAIWLLVPTLGAAAPFVAAAGGVLLFQVIPSLLRVRRNEKRLLSISTPNSKGSSALSDDELTRQADERVSNTSI
jgi:O-antigen/teichoic acid export membrane protein